MVHHWNDEHDLLLLRENDIRVPSQVRSGSESDCNKNACDQSACGGDRKVLTRFPVCGSPWLWTWTRAPATAPRRGSARPSRRRLKIHGVKNISPDMVSKGVLLTPRKRTYVAKAHLRTEVPSTLPRDLSWIPVPLQKDRKTGCWSWKECSGASITSWSPCVCKLIRQQRLTLNRRWCPAVH